MLCHPYKSKILNARCWGDPQEHAMRLKKSSPVLPFFGGQEKNQASFYHFSVVNKKIVSGCPGIIRRGKKILLHSVCSVANLLFTSSIEGLVARPVGIYKYESGPA
jgi:hypothetical protein